MIWKYHVPHTPIEPFCLKHQEIINLVSGFDDQEGKSFLYMYDAVYLKRRPRKMLTRWLTARVFRETGTDCMMEDALRVPAFYVRPYGEEDWSKYMTMDQVFELGLGAGQRSWRRRRLRISLAGTSLAMGGKEI